MTTYRLQFHSEFTFADAKKLVPYLDALGITDIYASPFLKASPGSRHGYDICDHSQLNPELGTAADFERFSCALRTRGMRLILDFVPNHMGLDPATNSWWRSVLTHGPSSPFAEYFDIDWHPLTRELEDRVLLPVLQAPYGEVLERGEIRLALTNGELHFEYFDRTFPIDPRSAALVLRFAQSLQVTDDDHAASSLDRLATPLESLPLYTSRSPSARAERVQAVAMAASSLAATCDHEPAVRERLARAIAVLNGVAGEAATFDRLHQLLEAQPYRLAYWRTAFDEINYRRFFDVNELGGLRMEHAPAFDDAHRFVVDLIRGGKIDGLRIDHPDGLLDPAGYFARLQAAVAEGRPDADRPLYVVGEKILADGETLPSDWPIAGTTGYGFLNIVNGLFVDGSRRSQMAKVYTRVTGRLEHFDDVAYHAKRLIMSSSLSSELSVLVHLLKDLAASDRHTRDFTANALRRAIVETVACFPVYRTYIGPNGISAADRDAVDFAIDLARRRNPVMASALFLFLRNVLLAQRDQAPSASTTSAADADEWLAARRFFAMKFQQFSAPVQAKGVEDTAFYRHAVLLSLNEVGGDPARYGHGVEMFHAGNRVRLERWPLEMLATSTHDTKRGEDARARLNVLSEMPKAWHQAVASWMRLTLRRRAVVDRQPAPDRTDEYIYYQALLAAWPAEALDAPVPLRAPADLVERMRQYMHKVVKEAKRHTSWIGGNTAYEDAMSRFVETTLAGPAAPAFLGRFVPFARRVARAAVTNSLAQVTLKLTAPGVPDTYQGSELWNFDLADPDNRRAVDYSRRQTLLVEIMPWITEAERINDRVDNASLESEVARWLNQWPDGRIKLYVTARLARWRRRDIDLFQRGDYDALSAHGPEAAHVIAFRRTNNQRSAIVIAPRLTSLTDVADGSAAAFWESTRLVLGAEPVSLRWRHMFSGAVVEARRDDEGLWFVSLAEVFRSIPVCVLAPLD